VSAQMTLAPAVVWGIIAGMAAVNFLVRFIPLAVVTRLKLPEPVMRWLSYVPISVMGALVATEVLRPQGVFVPPWTSPWLAGGLASAIVFWKTQSFLGATVAGMALFVVLRTLLGG